MGTRRRRRFRWWLGLLVGAGIGLALWRADAMFNGIGSPAVVRGMSLGEFAAIARADSASTARPRLQDVVVHPPFEDRQRVTARLQTDGAPIEIECDPTLPVQRPSRGAGTTQSTSYASLGAYLDAVAPKLSYRYAWWERPDLRAAVLIGLPAIVLGVLFPLTLWALVRAGLIAPPPEPEPESEPEVPAAEPTAVAADVTAPTPPPADEPIAVPAAGEPTTYEGGVYYPVHIPKHGEHDPAAPSAP